MNEIIGRMVAAMKATGLDVASWDGETVAELAVACLKVMRGWQPIATAPKDGRAVLIYDGTTFVGFFAQYSMDDGKGGRRVYLERWEEASGDGNTEFNPTHWMPLPEPPPN